MGKFKFSSFEEEEKLSLCRRVRAIVPRFTWTNILLFVDGRVTVVLKTFLFYRHLDLRTACSKGNQLGRKMAQILHIHTYMPCVYVHTYVLQIWSRKSSNSSVCQDIVLKIETASTLAAWHRGLSRPPLVHKIVGPNPAWFVRP
jgi:hypothetical protein